MKFKVIAVLGVVSIILGVASLGAVLQDLSEGIEEDTYLGFTMAVGFIAGGVYLYMAARRSYSIGWRMLLGLFLVFFGFVGASIEADSIVNQRAEDPVFGMVLAGAFAVSGFLLARSGYWRNRERGRTRASRVDTAAMGHSDSPGLPQVGADEAEKVPAGVGAEERF